MTLAIPKEQMSPQNLVRATNLKQAFEGVNLGYSHDDLWVRFRIDNRTNRTNWVMEPLPSRAHELEVWVFDSSDKLIYQWKGGEQFPHRVGRDLFSASITTPIELPRLSLSTVVVRLAAFNSLQASVRVGTAESFSWENARDTALDAAVLGIMVVMFFYNLFVFYFTKEKLYLHYLAYLSATCLYLLAYSRLGFALFWTDSVLWNIRSIPLHVMLICPFVILFCSNFLHLKHFLPNVNRLFQGLLIGTLLLLPYMAFGDPIIALRVGLPYSVLICIAFFITGVILAMRGDQNALRFVVAWSGFLLGTIALALNKLSFLPVSFLIENSQKFGIVLEVTLLSLALGSRFSEQRIHMERAQSAAALAEKERAAAHELVKLKERELEQAKENARMMSRLARLEELGIIAVHLGDRLNSPLNVLLFISEELKDRFGEIQESRSRSSEADEISVMLGRIGEHVDRMKGELEGLKKFREFAPEGAVTTTEDHLQEALSSDADVPLAVA